MSIQTGGSVLLVGNFLSAQTGNYSVCEDLAPRLRDAGLGVITTSHHRGRGRRLLDTVATIFNRRHDYSIANVDVYSGRAFLMAEAACAALRAVRKPYILTLRGGNLPQFSSRRGKRVARLLASAVAVTTPSQYLLDRMTSYRADLQLVPNPLDLAGYPFRAREKPAPRLIWLRSFHSTYNPSLAAQTVALLSDQFPDIQLTMVGRDKGDGSLQVFERTADQLGIADRVTVLGAVAKSEVPRVLQEADIFLNTTNVDNTPVSVMEAMACGLCVVSTDVGGMPYLIDDHQDGLLVPPQNPPAMADGVRRVLSDTSLAARLSRGGRKKAETFDWTTILPKWKQLFGSTCRQHGRPARSPDACQVSDTSPRQFAAGD